MKCEICHEDYPSKFYFKTDTICNKCYNEMYPAIDENGENEESPSQITGSRYPALIAISGLFKGLAIVIGIGTLIAILYGVNQLEGYRTKFAGTIIIISSLISGFIAIVVSLAISEIIKLFIDLEDNSRKQINLLNKFIDKK